jgi:beta-galactosidase
MKRVVIAVACACAAISGGGDVSADPARLKAEVRQTASGPMLFVNGRPTAPTIFFVNFDTEQQLRQVQLDQIASAGRRGVNIVSFPLPTPWPRNDEPRDFTETDRRVEAAIKANPNILILPRLGVSWPPQWWRDEHPDELMLYDDGTRGIPSIHSRLWRNEAARHVAALIQHLEEKFGDRMIGYHPCGQNTGEWFFDRSWEGRLSGFEPPARHAFRSFVEARYRTDEALRKAWGDPNARIAAAAAPTADERKSSEGSFRRLPEERKTLDFEEFQNEAMADVAEFFCGVVRKNAPGKLAVVFYGYHFEVAGLPRGLQSSGHLALGRMLKSKSVDVVCSPVSYFDRVPGGGGYFMAPVDSVQLGGKLWLIEDDTRTHLGEKDPKYAIQHTSDMRETKGVLARNFAHILTRGAAVWWMDLFGRGWFSGDEIWAFLGGLQNTFQASIDTLSEYKPEIAVIVDERSCLYLSPTNAVTNPLLVTFRKQWYRIGAPVGIYLLDDLIAGRVPQAKMYIFLDTFALDDSQIAAVRKHACGKGCVVVWMYAPGIVHEDKLSRDHIERVTGIALREDPEADGKVVLANAEEFSAEHGHLEPSFEVTDKDAEALARYASGNGVVVAAKKIGNWTSVYSGTLQLPASLLRDLAKRAGVHIYSNQDDVIAAGNGFVSVHASSGGPKLLIMPSNCDLTDSVTGETLGRGRSFRFEMKEGDTRLLRIGRPH